MVRCLLKRVVVGIGLSLLAAAPALSATNLYLDLPGIKGTATAPGNKDSIQIDSLQWGVGVVISSPTGGSTAPEVGVFSASEPVWSQRLDTSVPGLFSASLAGTQQPKARFNLVSSGNPDGIPYLSLEVGDMSFITGVSLANDYVTGSIWSNRYKLTYNPKGLDRKGSAVTTDLDAAKGIAKGSPSRAATSYAGTTSAATGSGTNMYLRLGDSASSIAGDSQAKGYENWIDLGSVQMDVGRGFATIGGAVSLSPPSVSELTWTQQDVATLPAMLANLAQGRVLDKAVIEYVMAGPNAPVTFMQLVLEDVLFSGLSLSADESGGHARASINFLKMTQTVWGVTEDGRAKDYTSFTYDPAKGGKASKGTPDTSKIALFGAGNLDGILHAAASQSAPPPMAPAIPEPKTWVMMLAGLSVLLSAVFRKKV